MHFRSILPALAFIGLTSVQAAGLSEAEFKEWHGKLAPPADEPWQDLPWKLSVLEAQALAAKEKKPVYMLVRSGHPLGCV